MKHDFLPKVSKIVLAFISAAANAQVITSDFTADADGWKGIDVLGPAYDLVTRGPYTLEIQATGGNPGGRVGTTDTNSTLFCFSAPDKFLGNRLGWYGGTLRYQMRFNFDSLSPGNPHPDVILIAGGLTLVADAGIDPVSQADIWVPFSVILNEANWHLNDLTGLHPTTSQFQAAISNITAIYIRGDFFNGVDRAWLDNVVMESTLPTLSIACGDNSVILQWPLWAAEFTLQHTQNLAESGTWTAVTVVPTIVGSQFQVTLSPLAPQEFFRLKR